MTRSALAAFGLLTIVPLPGATTSPGGSFGHAIAFSSWQSLVRDQGLAVAAAVELMAEMVDGRANGRKSTA